MEEKGSLKKSGNLPFFNRYCGRLKMAMSL